MPIQNLIHRILGSSNQTLDMTRLLHRQHMKSSTFLQCLLYYNFYFSIIFAFTNLLVVRWKVLNESNNFIIQYMVPFFFGIWCLAEVSRLYNGYTGNLNEEVPQLTAFLFLTLFPQGLFAAFNLILPNPTLPFDIIFNWIYLITLFLELFAGYQAAKVIIENKTARFAVEYGDLIEGDNLSAALDASLQNSSSLNSSELTDTSASMNTSFGSEKTFLGLGSHHGRYASQHEGYGIEMVSQRPRPGSSYVPLRRGSVIGPSDSTTLPFISRKLPPQSKRGDDRDTDSKYQVDDDDDDDQFGDDTSLFDSLTGTERRLERELARVRHQREREERRRQRQQWNEHTRATARVLRADGASMPDLTQRLGAAVTKDREFHDDLLQQQRQRKARQWRNRHVRDE